MSETMTPEEFAALTGCDLERLKRNIAEAEADAITHDTMDPSTFTWLGDPEKAKTRYDELRKQLAIGEPESI